MDESEVARAGLVEARRDSSEALEVVEEDLDEVARAIQLAVLRNRAFAFRLRADDGLDPARLQLGAERVRVIAGVSDQRVAASVVEELRRGDQFVSFAGSQRDVDRPAFGIDDRVDLGRKTSSRASQSILLDPPLPPDASWCARTIVPSTIDAVSSTSICNSRNT